MSRTKERSLLLYLDTVPQNFLQHIYIQPHTHPLSSTKADTSIGSKLSTGILKSLFIASTPLSMQEVSKIASNPWPKHKKEASLSFLILDLKKFYPFPLKNIHTN